MKKDLKKNLKKPPSFYIGKSGLYTIDIYAGMSWLKNQISSLNLPLKCGGLHSGLLHKNM